MKSKSVSSPYLSVAETAAPFGVSVTTSYRGRGLFADLAARAGG